MIRAVIFDLDGLLFDSEVYWARARTEYCLSLGCDWTDQNELSVKGNNSIEWATVIRQRCQLEVPYVQIIRAVSGRMKALYHEHLPVLPGAIDAVRVLADRYPLAIASSSPPDLIEFVLTQAGIRPCFSVLVSADEVARGKPAPDVYVVTAERLNLLPASIAVFEDSSAGIRAARAAGMRVIAVPNQHFPPAEEALGQADIVLGSLKEFKPDLFTRLNV